MIKSELNLALKCFKNHSEIRQLRIRLKDLKSKLQNIADSIDLKSVECTGWHVLLKKNNDKWEATECYNPDLDADGESEGSDFDIILPIPEPDNLREFDGF